MPSRAVITRMPLRSSRRCVTRRTVIESSTTSAKCACPRGRAAVASRQRARAPLGAHQRADVENHDDAPVTQDGGAGDAADRARSADPTDLTTISRLPTSSSATRAVECSPARTRITGTSTSCSGSSAGAAADECAQVLEAVFLAAVVEVGASSAQVLRRPRRSSRRTHAFDRRQRQRVDLIDDAHDQRLADRERERQADGERRARRRRRSR